MDFNGTHPHSCCNIVSILLKLRLWNFQLQIQAAAGEYVKCWKPGTAIVLFSTSISIVSLTN
jgi:hypothetical protein